MLLCGAPLVQAIAAADPPLSVGGDIAYNGDDITTGEVGIGETAYRQQHIPVYPALGNHDLHGDRTVLWRIHFQRFALEDNRYYSVRASIPDIGARQFSR